MLSSDPLEANLRRWGWLLVGLATVAIYIDTLAAPFVWDDRHLIVDALQGSDPASLGQYFSQPFWVEEGGNARAYFRPLTTLSFVLDRTVHGDNPAGYHLTNLLLHLLNVGFLLTLALRRATRAGIALFLVAVWAIHPRITEAVAWVSGRTDVLAFTFCLLGLWVHAPRNFVRGAASAVFVFLGLLSKEVALAAAAVLLYREWVHRDDAMPRSLWLRVKERVRFLLPQLLVLCAYVTLRMAALAEQNSVGLVLSVPERLLAALAAVGRYANSLLVPWWPQLQQGQLTRPKLVYALLGVATLMLIATIWHIHQKLGARRPGSSRSASYEMWVLGGVSLILVLHLVPISVQVVAADRFLYVPLAALALGLVPLLERVATNRRWLAAAAVYLSSLAVATDARVQTWGNELELWRQAYVNTPKTNGLPGNELGNVYYRAGMYRRALAIYAATYAASSGDVMTDSASIANNLANTLGQVGHHERAEEILNALCRQSPETSKYCLDAALIKIRQLELVDARALLARLSDRVSADGLVPVRRALRQVERALQDEDLKSPDLEERREARFRVALAAGQRLETLDLGKQLLSAADADAEVRQDAAEYWVRFGPPEELKQLLMVTAVRKALGPSLVKAAETRLEQCQPLLLQWSKLGIELPPRRRSSVLANSG